MNMSTTKKLAYRWMGPYQVRNAIPEKGTYELEEFDGTLVPGMHPGNRLKKFVKRKGLYEPVRSEEEEEEGSEAKDARECEGSDENIEQNKTIQEP